MPRNRAMEQWGSCDAYHQDAKSIEEISTLLKRSTMLSMSRRKEPAWIDITPDQTPPAWFIRVYLENRQTLGLAEANDPA